MDPITIGLGAAALGSLVQLYQSEKARGAEKKRLKEIEKLYNEIKPPEYDLRIIDPPELHDEKLKSPEFAGPLAAPKFNLSKLTPEQFKQVGKFIPEVAPYIAEQNPKLIEKTADMRAGREAQLNALRRFQEIGAGEFDPEYQEAVTKAARAAQGEAQSRQQSILQDFARRGQSGSGLNLAAQLGASSQAMDRGAMANLDAASQAYRNRLQALSQGASLGGQISQEDQNFQQRNADIINAFNQRMSTQRQAYENQRTAQMNQAQQYNLGVEQSLANMNTQSANQAMQADRSRLDDIAKFNYDVAARERARQDENAKYKYGQDVNERNYQNQLAMNKYNMAIGSQARQNDMLRQQYQDALNKAGLKAGVSQQMGQSSLQATQDRNAAIQGLSNVGLNYAQGQQARADQRSQNMASTDRSFYEKQGRFMDDDERDSYKKRLDEYDYY